MEHIKETLKTVIKDIEQKRCSGTKDVFKVFRQNLANRERRHTKCSALKKGVLWVNVDSSAWVYHLSLKKEELLDKLGIKDIRFRIGEIK